MFRESEPSELSKFYRKTLDIIYAFIIGQSFLSLDPLLKSVRDIFEFHNSVDLLIIFFAYFVVILGWIQHHKSITLKPHTGKFGNARYGVDLIILFLTYYLLRLSEPASKVAYGEVFLWLLPMTFFWYTIWDLIKYHEFYSDPLNKVLPERLYTSVFFGFAFIMLGCIYYINVISLDFSFTSDLMGYHNFWENKTSVDVYYVISAFALYFVYRYRKWDDVRINWKTR